MKTFSLYGGTSKTFSLYGGWPLVPSETRPNEQTIKCPHCGSVDITLTVEPGPLGTGPGQRWRMGDPGGRELALCNSCGKKGYLMDKKFQLGRVVITPAAAAALEDKKMAIEKLIERHVGADWGDLDDEDKQANNEALKSGARILSKYTLGGGVVIWILTEADRSATTLLLPSDY